MILNSIIRSFISWSWSRILLLCFWPWCHAMLYCMWGKGTYPNYLLLGCKIVSFIFTFHFSIQLWILLCSLTLILFYQDLDEFKTILKPRLKLIVQNDEREWFIVFVSKAHPANDQANKMAKKVYAKLEVEFSSKKRER